MWAIGGEQHKMHQDSTKLAVVLLQDQQVQLQQISSLHNVLWSWPTRCRQMCMASLLPIYLHSATSALGAGPDW